MVLDEVQRPLQLLDIRVSDKGLQVLLQEEDGWKVAAVRAWQANAQQGA